MDNLFDDPFDLGFGDFIGEDNLAQEEQDKLNQSNEDEVLRDLLDEMSDEYDADESDNNY